MARSRSISGLPAFAVAGALGLAACSGSAAPAASPSSAASPSGAASAKPAASPSGSAAAPASAKPAASSSAAASPAASQNLVPANYALSTSGSATLLPQNVAIQQGFFAKHGLKTDLVSIQGGPPTIAAIQAGDIAAGVVSTQLLFNGVAQGAPIIAVAEEVEGYVVHVIVSPKVAQQRNMTLTTSTDTMLDYIKGLKVGNLAPGSSTTVMFQGLLKAKGKSNDWIQSGNTGSPEAGLAALQNGVVDAIVASPPGGEIAEDAGYGKIIWSTLSLDEFKSVAYGITIMNPAWAEGHPQVAEGMVAALDDAQKWIFANPAEAQQLAAKLFPNLPASQLPAIIKDMAFAPTSKPSPDGMKSAQKLANNYNMTNTPVSDDVLAKSYTTKYYKG
jgi:ABC-type nitrate/sulfonate/bicarbonate transport system substrate-binding protein